ncbi:hypothetical protein H0H87_003270 [Tephrocybe sp. NHM501043]|nr:hypothetical protein H0H87_003270 [Tephrocybe sp. NHM501043]
MSSFEVKEINEAYFNACNFESLMRGIHFAVFLMALSKIYTGPERSARSRRVMTILVVLFFVMSTIHHATFWAYVRRAFIAHGETAESIADALNEYPVWFTGTTSVSDANAVLADGVITVTSTSFGAVGVDYATALYSTSLATTLYCTAAIVYRVIQVGRQSRVGYRLRSYRGVIEILVESSMLYFIATLFALVAYVTSGPASEYASAFWTAVTVRTNLTLSGIAPTLVVARVAAGEARPNKTWNETRPGPALSFLRFNKTFDGTHELGTMTTRTHVNSQHTDAYLDDVETSALPISNTSLEIQSKPEKSAV